MPSWYPLQFTPLFRRYLWGGRRLSTLLQKPIGVGDDYAESWEIVDRGPDQSVVRSGALAGRSLQQLVSDFGPQLFGRHAVPTRFPLLLKFLDANSDLSVQVHPNDAQGARLTPPDLGKTEAWWILSAEPGSRLYAGLRDGCTARDFHHAVAVGRTADCLHVCQPRAGECYFIPAGTVHALGAGLVVAEIQQASDTTYRLFDWNRTGPDGQPRTLHIEQGLAAIDFSAGPVATQVPSSTAQPQRKQLVHCDRFVLNRWDWSGPMIIGGDDQFRILAVLGGQVEFTGPGFTPITLRLGDVTLLPAELGALTAHGDQAVMMESHLPPSSAA